MDKKEKPISQMTEDEQIQFVKNRVGTAIKSSLCAVVVFLGLFVIYNAGKKVLDPYPEVTPISTVYSMDSPADYINANIGEKIQYSDLFIWNIDTEAGVAKELFFDVYFREGQKIDDVRSGSRITVKGTIDGLKDNRFIIRDAILVDVDNSLISQFGENNNEEASGTQSDSIDSSTRPDDYYDISITGEQLIQEANSNMARTISTYKGQRVKIIDLEIASIYSDYAYFDVLTRINFRDSNDLYAINAGDHITVIGSIVENFGTYCIDDAVLVETAENAIVENNLPDTMPDTIPDAVPDDFPQLMDFGEFEGEYHMAHNYTVQMYLWFESDMSGVNQSNWHASEPLELHFQFNNEYEILGDGIAYWWPLSDGLPYFDGELYSSLDPITLEYDGYNFVVNCSALDLYDASFFKD